MANSIREVDPSEQALADERRQAEEIEQQDPVATKWGVGALGWSNTCISLFIEGQ